MAGAYDANGVRLTHNSDVSDPTSTSDPLILITQNVYADFALPGTDVPGRHLVFHDGQVVRTSELTALFTEGTIVGALVPATGAAAGGTVVDITGTGLDGATGVLFGSTPGTAFSVISPTHIRVTSPAHATGVVSVTVQDDAADIVKLTAFTYT
jgi:hypothetical protein